MVNIPHPPPNNKPPPRHFTFSSRFPGAPRGKIGQGKPLRRNHLLRGFPCVGILVKAVCPRLLYAVTIPHPRPNNKPPPRHFYNLFTLSARRAGARTRRPPRLRPPYRAPAKSRAPAARRGDAGCLGFAIFPPLAHRWLSGFGKCYKISQWREIVLDVGPFML